MPSVTSYSFGITDECSVGWTRERVLVVSVDKVEPDVPSMLEMAGRSEFLVHIYNVIHLI